MAKSTNYKGIHITVTYAMGYDYYEIPQINKGKKWNEKILFSTLKEAKIYIDKHYDELIKNESKKTVRKSLRESYDYDDIKDETPIIDVWGNSEGTHVYKVFKINSDYIYYEYNYRKHDSTDKHYGKLKKYNSNYYWQAVRFIKNSMLKDDDPDASNYFDEADDIINDAFEQNGDSFRV